MRFWAPGLLLGTAVALFLLYLPAFPDSFFLLDDSLLTQIPQLQNPLSWRSLINIFTPGLHADYYPIRDLSYLIDIKIFGGSPAVFRVHQFVLFALTAWGLAKLLVSLGAADRVAYALASIWLLAPSHAQSLVWVSLRKDALALLFGVWSAYFVSRALPSDRARYWLLANLCFALSAFSKASLLIVPWALAIPIAGGRLRPSARAWRAGLLPMATISMGATLLQTFFYSSYNDMRAFFPWSYRLPAAAAGLGKVVAGWILPSFNVLDGESWGQWLALNSAHSLTGYALWIALLGAFLWALWARRVWVLFALGAFALCYLPTSAVFFRHKNFYFVHYGEAMLLCAAAALGYFVSRRWRLAPRKLGFALLGLWLLCLAGTVRDAPHWFDPIAVQRKAVADQPESISLNVALLSEIQTLANAKPPDAATLGEIKALHDWLTKRCPALDPAFTPQPSGDNCWSYFTLQLHNALNAGRNEDARRWYDLLVASFKDWQPPMRFIQRWGARTLIKIGAEPAELAALQPAFFTQPEESYRLYGWALECLVGNVAAARAQLEDYQRRELLSASRVREFYLREAQPQYLKALVACAVI